MNLHSENKRYHSLDALRTIAMLSIVIAHSAGAYGSSFYLGIHFPVNNTSESSILFFGNMGLLINAFCMQLFFIMSGFFAFMSFGNRGLKPFLLTRSKRILLPFLASLVFIYPSSFIIGSMGFFDVELITAWLNNNPKLHQLYEFIIHFFKSGEFLSRFELGHLWFLWYLLAFYIIFTLINIVSYLLCGKKWLDRCFVYIWKSPLSLLFLTVPTVLLKSLMTNPVGIDSHGVTSPAGLSLPLSLFTYYGFFFTIGVMLYRHRQFLPLAKRSWQIHLFISIISMVSYFICIKVQLTERMTWITHSIHGVWTWSSILALLGIFLKYFDKFSPKWRYTSDASYWIYLVHLIPILYLQIIAKKWFISPFVSFIFVLAVATPILFLSYHYCVRYTLIGRILNGPRKIVD